MKEGQRPSKKTKTGQWSDKNNQDKSFVPKRKGKNGAVEKTTLFPHGTKPFKRGENDNEEARLLALGEIISQEDKNKDNLEGDKCHTGAKEEDEGHNFLSELDGFVDELGFNAGVGLFQDQSGNGSHNGSQDEDHISVSYSSDENENKAFTKDNSNNEDKVFTGDNTPVDVQSDKSDALVEIIARSRKPVLTKQIIMELVENQASSSRTPSNVGWEKKKDEYSQMLEGWESPTSRTVQVDVGLATLMIISAVAESTNKINLAAQHEQRELMIK